MATKKTPPAAGAATAVAVRKPTAGGVVSIKEAIAAQIAPCVYCPPFSRTPGT